jgi:hypothetical protein
MPADPRNRANRLHRPVAAAPSIAAPSIAAPAPGRLFVLLERARAVLAEAIVAETPDERFRLAHLAALRTAAAVLARRGRPAGARRRLVSAWVLIESVSPEYADWATYFSAAAPRRAAIEAGAQRVVSDREADDQVRAALQFLGLVEDGLGVLAAPLAS